MKTNKPYLLVGQGIAGTVLAHHFLQANIPFEIWDSPRHFNSSFAAGGIFNPVTGRKLEKTWMAEALFDYLFPFYQQLEATLGKAFFLSNAFVSSFCECRNEAMVNGSKAGNKP